MVQTLTKVAGLTLYAADINYFQDNKSKYDMIYDTFVNYNSVDKRWQFYSTYLQTNNTKNNTTKQNT